DTEVGEVFQGVGDAAGAEGSEPGAYVGLVGVAQGREASGQGGAVPVGQDCCGVGRRSCVHQGVGGQQDVEETVLFEAFGGGVSDGVVQSGRALERSEEHTSELQSRFDLVCRLLL